MNKKLKYMLASALIVTVLSSTTLTHAESINTNQSVNAENTTTEKTEDKILHFETAIITKNDPEVYYDNKDKPNLITRFTNTGGMFSLEVLNSKNEQIKPKDLDYKYTINNKEYKISLNTIDNYYIVNAFMDKNVLGKVKIEFSLKSDPSIKGTYEYEIIKPIKKKDFNPIISNDYPRSEKYEKYINISFDRLTGKYTVKFDNPNRMLNNSLVACINPIDNKIYRTNDSFVMDNNDKTYLSINMIFSDNGVWELSQDKRWTYKINNNIVPINTKILINNNNYLFDDKGFIYTGWANDNNNWQFYNTRYTGLEGAQVLNQWKLINGIWYYFDKDGNMLKNTTIDGLYHLNDEGSWVYNQWVLEPNGKWWFPTESGFVVGNKVINGDQYYFDQNGWMYVGWKYDNNNWQFYNTKYTGSEGSKVINQWKLIDGNWYYFDNNGNMLKNITIGSLYHLNDEGKWVYNQWVVEANGKWWFPTESGFVVGNKLINGNQYYFDQNGWMHVGWKYDNNNWQFYNTKYTGLEGAKVINQWKLIDGNWYYFYKDGNMAHSTTIDNMYVVDKDGKWIH